MRLRKYTSFEEIDGHIHAKFYWATIEHPHLAKKGTAKFTRERWNAVVCELIKHMPLNNKWLIHYSDKCIKEFKETAEVDTSSICHVNLTPELIEDQKLILKFFPHRN